MRGFHFVQIDLEESEYVKEISGTFGQWGRDGPIVITSLKIRTNKHDVPYEFGRACYGDNFHLPVYEGKITGFFGRDGDLLDAIGVYVLP